jgi:hypothetical protein
MVTRSTADTRLGKPKPDSSLRKHPTPERAGQRRSTVRGGVLSSAPPPSKNLHEIDDDRTGAKALATADCDLAPLNRSVTSAIGLPMSMCKIGDLTHLTLEYEKSAFDALMLACGTKEPDFVHGLIHQIASAGSKGQYPDEPGIKFMLAAFKGIEPRDQIDAMLAAQMVATHVATMRAANRLGHAETLQEQDSAERTFNKLARTYAAQVEARQRYRSDREDTVVVQQVMISEGGQALVGNVTRPRPRLNKQAAVTPALADSRQRPMKIIDARQRAPARLQHGEKE